MKKCTTLHTFGSMDGWITSENYVVYDTFHQKEDMPPPKHAFKKNGVKYYTPENAIDSTKDDTYVILPFISEGKYGYCDRWDGEVLYSGLDYCEHFVSVAGHREIARIAYKKTGDFDCKAIRSSSFDFNWHDTSIDGEWRYIDTSERQIIPKHTDDIFCYQYLSSVRNNIILAKNKGLWGVLNVKGDIISEFKWNDICFDDDYGFMTRLDTETGPRYSIFTNDGRMLIGDLPQVPIKDTQSHSRWYEKNFLRIDPYDLSFDDPLYHEWKLNSYFRNYCRYYKHNDVDYYNILMCMPEMYGKLKAEIILYSSSENIQDSIDYYNKQLAEMLYQHDNMSWALIDDRMYPRSDWNGNFNAHFTCQYDCAYPNALFTTQKITGTINPKGEIVVLSESEFISPSCVHFSYDRYNMTPFSINGKWGYYDRNNRVIIPPQWGFCDTYYEGSARFNLCEGYDMDMSDIREYAPINHSNSNCNGRWGCIDDDGRLLIPPVYEYISQASDGRRLAKKDGFWACISADNVDSEDNFMWDDMWLDPIYDYIAKKQTRHGFRYAVYYEGKKEFGDLKSFPEFDNEEGLYIKGDL